MSNAPITQAMILAAGEGRRLRPLTEHTPKPLIQIGGKTLLDQALDHLEAYGVEKCVINTHYLADQIHAHVKTRKKPKVFISHEPILLDTGGGVAQALPHFKGEPFFVLNSDIWWKDAQESCLHQMNKLWDSEKMDALLLLMPCEKAIGYSGVGDYFLTAEGKAKFRGENATAPFIFSGIRILHPRLLKGEKVHPFPILPFFHTAENLGRLYGMVFEGEWGDIGTIESLKAIEAEVFKRNGNTIFVEMR